MGKVILITGSSSGIGKATALGCAQKGASVIIHGRNKNKVQKTVKEIISKTGNKNISFVIADFSDLSQVKLMVDELYETTDKIDVLINNACVFEHNYQRTSDCFESTFQICYLAHFLLTLKLMDLVKNSANGRIINVSSMVHAHSLSYERLNSKEIFDGYTAYETAKLANILFTYELAERLKKEKITVNCLHPGVISTKLLHKGWGMGGASVGSGAQIPLYLAFSEDVSEISGKYFIGYNPTRSASITYDPKFRQEFWKYTEKQIHSAMLSAVLSE